LYIGLLTAVCMYVFGITRERRSVVMV
jgi:hypothetical protein